MEIYNPKPNDWLHSASKRSVCHVGTVETIRCFDCLSTTPLNKWD